jgi:hypothetical protein
MLHHRAPCFLCMSVKSSRDNDCVCFVLDQHAEFEVYIVLTHWNNSSWVDMLHHTDTLCAVYVGQKLTRWWWCLLSTGPTHWVGGLHSPSSLKHSPWVDMLHHRAPCFLCISVKSSRDNDGVCFLLDQHAEWEVYCVLAHWNISSWVDMLHHTGTLCVVYVGQKLTRSWWCLFCTGTTRWVWGLYSLSSLKQQSVSRYVGPPGTLFFVYVGQKLTRSWWCLLCTGSTRWIWGLYSPSSMKQQSVSRYAGPPGTFFFVYVGQKLTRSWWCLLWIKTLSLRFI